MTAQNKIIRRLLATSALVLAPIAMSAQSFSTVETDTDKKLDSALSELASLQESIAKEKIPLATKLNSLEAEVEELNADLKRLERLRDTRDLNLSALENEIKARRDEIDYAKNLLVEFVNNQTASADASERQLYEAQLLEVLNSADAPIENPEEAVGAIKTLLDGVDIGIDRLNTIIGGYSFDGSAVLADGTYAKGKFLLYGPVAFFSSSDGSDAGITLQGDSGEPTLVSLTDTSKGLSEAVLAGSGPVPLDPTLGKALAMETTKESLVEHIQKGGFWIYPIIAIAIISLIIAVIKLFELQAISRVPKDKLVTILTAIQEGNKEQALSETRGLSGAAKDLLEAGVKNIGHGRDLIEQSMEEVLMKLQPKLERLLSVIWITAATAPLLGLLGTVTGIITTFKLLTIFGSGDPKALGGGISEALITTEFGLIVAIPSLVLHAFLQRKAKSIEDEFEGDAMTLLNGILRAEKK
ncbi:MotA/TolQ/ExbB proton channel family protein [Coraliomargarita parva]|uniref:MotA/TolQ/ExbB proton channel family protein n=1 Tax=Coraliomargarita parva TaxID=3014050 RepID=UPI0022B50274|nr:MotA/TolQ/ExbB proton channel family protein [Coraliomargarita parva]